MLKVVRKVFPKTICFNTAITLQRLAKTDGWHLQPTQQNQAEMAQLVDMHAEYQSFQNDILLAFIDWTHNEDRVDRMLQWMDEHYPEGHHETPAAPSPSPARTTPPPSQPSIEAQTERLARRGRTIV